MTSTREDPGADGTARGAGAASRRRGKYTRQDKYTRRAEYDFLLVGRRFVAYDADGVIQLAGTVLSIVGEDKALLQLADTNCEPSNKHIVVRLDDLVTARVDLRWELGEIVAQEDEP